VKQIMVDGKKLASNVIPPLAGVKPHYVKVVLG